MSKQMSIILKQAWQYSLHHVQSVTQSKLLLSSWILKVSMKGNGLVCLFVYLFFNFLSLHISEWELKKALLLNNIKMNVDNDVDGNYFSV